MRHSIFEIENRINIDKEFRKLIKTLNESEKLWYNNKCMSYFVFLNRTVFNLWEYRDTFIELDDYLEHIGIDCDTLRGFKEIKEKEFLNFMELLLNLKLVIERKIGFDNITFFSNKVQNIIDHNIPIILEKMNYKTYNSGDKVLITKRDADVDSILENVPKNVADLLLEYNDIRNNNFEAKKSILKDLDLFIESSKRKYKSYNSSTYDTIQTIVNKMGINHPITEKPYTSFSPNQLIEWFDKCFKLMIHLIRCEQINEINSERDDLVNTTN